MKILNFKKIVVSGIIGIMLWGGFLSFASAACPTGSSDTICFENPIAYNTVDEILTALLDNLRAIIITLALVFIVVGAILYITSAGSEGRMTLAKNAIFAAVIGLAIGIAAPSFLKEIYTVLAPGSVPGTVSGSLSLTQIALNVLNFLLSVVGVIGIIMLVASGITYLTSAGNEGQIETAKKMTTWAIVGIAIALGALVIVKQLASFFS
jgi:hypothetical protein